MRSSSAIVALAVLAASPALSAPLQAFDVEARAIPGAGAQDAVIEEAMQALLKSTPSTPPQAREIVGALQRELTDEQLQLVARFVIPAAGLNAIDGALRVAVDGAGRVDNAIHFISKQGPAALVAGGAAATGGLAAGVDVINHWNWLRTGTPPAQAREVAEALQRELLARDINPLFVIENAGHVGGALEGVAKNSKRGILRTAGLIGGGGLVAGGLAASTYEAFKHWFHHPAPPPPPAPVPGDGDIVGSLP